MGQVFKGGGSLAADGEWHTGRAVAVGGAVGAVPGACIPPTKTIRVLSANIRRRRAVCSHQSADVCRKDSQRDEAKSQSVLFMTGVEIEETSFEPVTRAVS